MLVGSVDLIIGWVLGIATVAARLVSDFRKPTQVAKGNEIESEISKLLETVPDPDIRSLQPLGQIPFARSVQIAFLGDRENGEAFSLSFVPPKGTRAVLKRSYWSGGMESLVRQHDRVVMLHSELPTSDYDFRVPQIVAFDQSPDVVWSIEKFIAGKDGRAVIQNPELRILALAATANAISCIQPEAARQTTIDSAWIEEWIDLPAARIAEPVHTLMSKSSRKSSIAAFTRELRAYWLGRKVTLGWYHGDFNPGNIMFREEAQGQGTGETSSASAVAGIIDWDRSGRNGPAGFDICHLAISARRVLAGQQIGEITRDVLLARRWTAEEMAWFADCNVLAGPAGEWTHDAGALRAMVALVWLRLVTSNIEKSSDYLSNRLWASANVERVLRLWL